MWLFQHRHVWHENPGEEGKKKELFDCDEYDKLTDEEKAIYQKIYEAMMEAIANGESSVTIEKDRKSTL